MSRRRECDNPLPTGTGDTCPGAASQDGVDCATEECPATTNECVDPVGDMDLLPTGNYVKVTVVGTIGYGKDICTSHGVGVASISSQQDYEAVVEYIGG